MVSISFVLTTIESKDFYILTDRESLELSH